MTENQAYEATKQELLEAYRKDNRYLQHAIDPLLDLAAYQKGDIQKLQAELGQARREITALNYTVLSKNKRLDELTRTPANQETVTALATRIKEISNSKANGPQCRKMLHDLLVAHTLLELPEPEQSSPHE